MFNIKKKIKKQLSLCHDFIEKFESRQVYKGGEFTRDLYHYFLAKKSYLQTILNKVISVYQKGNAKLALDNLEKLSTGVVDVDNSKVTDQKIKVYLFHKTTKKSKKYVSAMNSYQEISRLVKVKSRYLYSDPKLYLNDRIDRLRQYVSKSICQYKLRRDNTHYLINSRITYLEQVIDILNKLSEERYISQRDIINISTGMIHNSVNVFNKLSYKFNFFSPKSTCYDVYLKINNLINKYKKLDSSKVYNQEEQEGLSIKLDEPERLNF